MKLRILLLGEYSNVHHTLALGLRALGHSVTVVSDGDGWKDYPRDVDVRRDCYSRWSSLKYWWKISRLVRTFSGYDVVQLINPVFFPLKAERLWNPYRRLRENNRSVFLGAFGMDHYYLKAGLDRKTFRYSDFNLGDQLRDSEEIGIWKHDWGEGAKGRLNRYVASTCDGIIAGLYEYYAAYRQEFSSKLTFIPFPICVGSEETFRPRGTGDKVRFFIGIQRLRSAYKGTDIMLRALERVVARFPQQCEMVRVESVPFEQYCQLMESSDVLLDQLYSYTPGMNALEAMARGLVVVGGGEEENYDILREEHLRPIINVLPTEEDVYLKLCDLVEHRDRIPQLSRDSRRYIQKHHGHIAVAQRYVDYWTACHPSQPA